MTKDEEIRYLRFLLSMVNNKLLHLTKPYDLTINEIHKEIRDLEDLREILKNYQEPVKIDLQPQSFNKRHH